MSRNDQDVPGAIARRNLADRPFRPLLRRHDNEGDGGQRADRHSRSRSAEQEARDHGSSECGDDDWQLPGLHTL